MDSVVAPQRLPEDVLAGILRRLPPRSLAVSRCVCKAWRAMVDARRLLRADLLPLKLGGIIVTLNDPGPSEFFSRPSPPGRRVAGKLDYVNTPHDWSTLAIVDHCNGLVLLDNHVVNPATQQWARLPPFPPRRVEWEAFCDQDMGCLVFDPAVSPHYEVFLSHFLHRRDELDPATDRLEWPPSPYIMRAFSSRTGRWEERQFVREGEAFGTIADMRSAGDPFDHRYHVYRSGALYMHCQHNVFLRITLSNDKYQVIKLPEGVEVAGFPEPYLGNSKDGVCCGLVYDSCKLKVWLLDESRSQMEWVLKFDVNLEPLMADLAWRFDNQPWMLDVDEDVDDSEVLVEEKFEWDSDNDDFLGTEDRIEKNYDGYLTILGFHPYKEVVFLYQSNTRVLAYHLNSSKVQYLGKIRIRYSGDFICMAFPYMPCWTGDLSHNN